MKEKLEEIVKSLENRSELFYKQMEKDTWNSNQRFYDKWQLDTLKNVIRLIN